MKMRGKIIRITLIGILICLGFITMNSLGNKKKVEEHVLGQVQGNELSLPGTGHGAVAETGERR